MSNCKCKECKCKKSKAQPRVKRPPVPASVYLAPLPKPPSDPTPLDRPCTCDDSPKGMRRDQCWQCIQSWARAVGWRECWIKAMEYEDISRVAADRLHQAADELKQNRRLKPGD